MITPGIDGVTEVKTLPVIARRTGRFYCWSCNRQTKQKQCWLLNGNKTELTLGWLCCQCGMPTR